MTRRASIANTGAGERVVLEEFRVSTARWRNSLMRCQQEMTDDDAFIAWVKTTLYDAEVALHNGDAAPRRALWSRNEPVSGLGAWRNAHGQQELDELFAALGRSFSDCTSYEFELQAFDVVGGMAYTAGLEHTTASIDGQPRSYTLRATQVYRREGGEWKVAHRHGDTVTE